MLPTLTWLSSILSRVASPSDGEVVPGVSGEVEDCSKSHETARASTARGKSLNSLFIWMVFVVAKIMKKV